MALFGAPIPVSYDFPPYVLHMINIVGAKQR